MSATLAVGVTIAKIALRLSGKDTWADVLDDLTGGAADAGLSLRDRRGIATVGQRVAADLAETVRSTEFRSATQDDVRAASRDLDELLTTECIDTSWMIDSVRDPSAFRQHLLDQGGQQRADSLAGISGQVFLRLLDASVTRLCSLARNSPAFVAAAAAELLIDAQATSERLRELLERPVAGVVHALDADTYLESVVKPLAPVPLAGRERELVQLAEIATGPSRSWHGIRATAKAGKTALAATFALNPPQGVQVVPYFVRSEMIATRDRSAYLGVALAQLARLAGRSHVAFPSNPHQERTALHALITEAAASLQADDPPETLVMLVDGVDEDAHYIDQRTGSILSLLPADPPPGVSVIFFCRSNPAPPTDLLAPSAGRPHPALTEEIWEELAKSPHAEAAFKDDDLAVLTAKPAGLDLAAFLHAAGAPLTASNLKELLVHAHPETTLDSVRQIINGAPGRLLISYPDPNPDRPAAYALGHTLIGQGITARLLPGEPALPAATNTAAWHVLDHEALAKYRTRIHDWAGQFAAAKWPYATPAYLLGDAYPQLIDIDPDQNHLAVDTLCSVSRQDRLLELHGSYHSAIQQARAAVHRSIPPSRDRRNPAPINLTNIGRLLQTIERMISFTGEVPVSLPALYAELGRRQLADDLANGITEPSARARALAELARECARLGDVAIAQQLVTKVVAVSEDALAMDLDSVMPTRMRFDDEDLDEVDIARLHAAVGHHDDARTIIDLQTQRWGNSELAIEVAEEYVAMSDYGRARAYVAKALEMADDSGRPENSAGLLRIARALTAVVRKTEDPITERNRILQASDLELEKSCYDGFFPTRRTAAPVVMAQVALIHALLGNTKRAYSLARRCDDLIDAILPPADAARAWIDLAETWWLLGNGEHGRARAEKAYAVCRDGRGEIRRSPALLQIVDVCEANHADDLIVQIMDDSSLSRDFELFCHVARAYIVGGNPTRAMELAREWFLQLTSSEWTNADRWTRLGAILARGGEVGRASDAASEALKAARVEGGRHQVTMLDEIVDAYLAIGALAPAREAALRRGEGVAEPEDNDWTVQKVAEAYLASGDLDQALALADRLVEPGWTKMDIYVRTANSLILAGKVEDAIRLADRAHAMPFETLGSQILGRLGRVYARASAHDAARDMARWLLDESRTAGPDANWYQINSDQLSVGYLIEVYKIYIELSDHEAVYAGILANNDVNSACTVLVAIAETYAKRLDVDRARLYLERFLFLLKHLEKTAPTRDGHLLTTLLPDWPPHGLLGRAASLLSLLGDGTAALSILAEWVPRPLQIDLLIKMARSHLAVGDLEKAREYTSIARGRKHLREDDPPTFRRSRGYDMADDWAAQISDLYSAMNDFTESLAAADEVRDARRRAALLLRISAACANSGDRDEAIRIADMGRFLITEKDAPSISFDSDPRAVRIAGLMAAYVLAGAHDRAYDVARGSEVAHERASGFIKLTHAYLRQNDLDRASRSADEASDAARSIRHPETKASVLGDVASLYARIWECLVASKSDQAKRSNETARLPGGASEDGDLDAAWLAARYAAGETWLANSYPLGAWEALVHLDLASAMQLETDLMRAANV